jgi:hypothetical protein
MQANRFLGFFKNLLFIQQLTIICLHLERKKAKLLGTCHFKKFLLILPNFNEVGSINQKV